MSRRVVSVAFEYFNRMVTHNLKIILVDNTNIQAPQLQAKYFGMDMTGPQIKFSSFCTENPSQSGRVLMTACWAFLAVLVLTGSPGSGVWSGTPVLRDSL